MRSKGVTAERVSPSSRCPSFSERPGSGRLSLPASWWLWVWLIVLVAGGNALAADRAEEQPTAGSGSGSGDAVHATDRSDTTGGSPEAEVLVVYGRGEPQLAHARSGSEGRISGADLELRPIARVGELLETVPGMIATQHSGPGKATQLFLRGFNLDHGTDFAAFYDGVPVNFRTHGHGQGYLDLNFVIPELVESIDYRKGPYRADVGDFGSAGAAFFRTRDRLPDSLATLTVGQDGYVRGLAATNVETGSTDWIVALEAKTYDDPYRLDANLLHLNGLAKLTRPAGPGTLRASVLGYHATWNSTDQIPRRAIGNPDPALRVSRLGFIDPDLGGETTRVGLTLDWQEESDHPISLATYFLYYRFRLFSDFTYFRDNPPPLGDEFEQTDRRFVWGARGRKDWAPELFGSPVTIDAGFDTRIDVVTDLGLFRTSNRHRFATVRRDDVVEGSGSLFAEFEWSPFEWMTWQAGLRGDLLVFDVDTGAGLGASSNSGTDVDGLVSPKLALILRPTDTVEIYVDGGGGFHSNDARGVTIRIDPTTGLMTRRVDPIARQWGSEVGLRWQPNERLHLTGVLWFLDSESELVFAGDS
ncbi:MAG TPA: hypothetical protein ENI85_05635, partial [Deltaproteobacteria bacterium]|nr:hypothetical protein [Deltaproteobacteria bacterium]